MKDAKNPPCNAEQANLEMLNDDIVEVASMICEHRGRFVESDLDNWLQAKEELRKRRWTA